MLRKNSLRKIILMSILTFTLFALLVPSIIAATNITADDTPCSGYTELYYEGTSLNIPEACLIRACFAENRGASFYFKYAKAHKQTMKITFTNYEQGTLEWSTGAKISIVPNQTIKVDLDNNGYYDQKVWYEFSKPDISQGCFKMYEIKESAQYKVPSANDLYFLEKTSSINSTNATKTNATNATKPATANTTNNTVVANMTLTTNTTNTTNTTANSNASETQANSQTPAETNTINTTIAPTTQSSIPTETTTETIPTTTAANNPEKENTNDNTIANDSVNSRNFVVGLSIIVGIIVLIVILYLVYERKRKHDFSVQINQEIGKVDLGKKQ